MGQLGRRVQEAYERSSGVGLPVPVRDDGTATTGLTDHVAAVLSSAGYRPEPPPGPSKARDRWESWAAIVEVARMAGVPKREVYNLVHGGTP